MSATRFSFDAGGAGTSGLLYRAEGAQATGSRREATVVLAHGAGAPQAHPWMVKMARALSARGMNVVTFNFLYTEKKKRVPDKNDVLEATWWAAIDAAMEQAPSPTLILAGKSMGGRIATQIAAQGRTFGGREVAALVLLGYPLHPPGKPEKLRAAHLPKVAAPMLFVQGSRDAFGTPEELEPIVRALAPGTRLFVVEGGDHSLSLPKSSGETLDATLARVADEVVRFTASR